MREILSIGAVELAFEESVVLDYPSSQPQFYPGRTDAEQRNHNRVVKFFGREIEGFTAAVKSANYRMAIELLASHLVHSPVGWSWRIRCARTWIASESRRLEIQDSYNAL